MDDGIVNGTMNRREMIYPGDACSFGTMLCVRYDTHTESIRYPRILLSSTIMTSNPRALSGAIVDEGR